MDDAAAFDHWKARAFDLSVSDRMGGMLQRAFDVLRMVREHGVDTPNLEFTVRSMENERSFALQNDSNSTDPLRSVIYGLTDCLGRTLDSLIQPPRAAESPKELKVEPFLCPPEMPMDAGLDVFSSSATAGDNEDVELTEDWIEEKPDALLSGAAASAGAAAAAAALPSTSAAAVPVINYRTSSSPQSRTGQSAARKPKDKRYQCDKCHYAFSKPNELAIHNRTHTGERPFSCELCARTFVAEGLKKNHLRIAHNILPYKCKQCGQQFSRSADQRKHQQESSCGGKE